MPATLRRLGPGDFNALRGLYAARGDAAAAARPDRLMAWILDHPEAPEGSLVAESSGTIVAHLGRIPCTFRLGGDAVRGAHTQEWIAAPSAGGAGIALMAHLLRTHDATIVIGGSAATRAILPGLGFRAVAEVPAFFRPLRPLRCALTLAAPPAARIARAALYAARGLLRRRGPAVEPAGIGLADLPEATPVPAGSVANAISRAHVRWLAACPVAEFHAVAPRGDDPAHRFALMLVDRALPGAPRGRIVHVACGEEDPRAWLRVAAAADRFLETLGCVSATTFASHPPLADAFRALGYASYPLPLFLHDRTGRLSGAPWHVTPADGDHAFRGF